MKTLILFTSLATLCGCKPDPYYTALQDYKCTSEQMEKAQKEAEWCNGNAGSNKFYCYTTAVMRNCEAPKNKQGE
jgi:hypothetical protein